MAKVLWFTGLSGAGKTTIAEALAEHLRAQGKTVDIIDGDVVRETFHQNLGFSEADIKQNQRLIIKLAKERAGEFDYIVVPVIAPLRELRDEARTAIGDGFVEVYVHSSQETRTARDPKGLYKKVAAGEITDMIGHGGVPYEVPEHADVVLDTDTTSVEECVAQLLSLTR
jgi:adenylyl-sulfate kinase